MSKAASGSGHVWHKVIIALSVILILLGGLTAAGFVFLSAGFF